MKKKAPTHKLKAFDRRTKRYTDAGVAWLDKTGKLCITLNPCVVLRDNPHISLILWPRDDKPK